MFLLVLGMVIVYGTLVLGIFALVQRLVRLDESNYTLVWPILFLTVSAILGVALAIFGIGTVNGIPVVLTIGGLMLVFGGTREAKGFGKVTKLVGLI